MTRDPDEWAMRCEPDPAAVMLTHLLLAAMGGAVGFVAGIAVTAWWLS